MNEGDVKRKYTMSEKALAVRRKTRKSAPKKISEETRQKRRESIMKIAGMNKKPPRIRIMVDKALAEQATLKHGDIDKALAYSLK